MNLPKIDPKTFGIEPSCMRCSIDTGVRIRKPEPKKPRKITPQEVDEKLGIGMAVKMNFIPQMIVSLALEETKEFLNYCAEKRLSEFKKHTRLIKSCVEMYADRLRMSYGSAYTAYEKYVDLFLEFISVDRFKMHMSISNAVCRQKGREYDRDVITRMVIIRSLLIAAEEYDKKIDRLLRETFEIPIVRKQDQLLLYISNLIDELETKHGFKIKDDPVIGQNMGVFANRAAALGEYIIKDEEGPGKIKYSDYQSGPTTGY